ncbi:hypothetical protein AUC69_14350 [Methyloceanibacter superfactus]|jgi:hypothetical protein|uniref:Uncharacterized protein n=1 Tax=Methyloceanibacter superfactus TaxID=1774969 RepID=A0A1E3VTB2_9HYPH|nr:hypothetical protein [Methyloceanibacter superfactus]ODR96762.1 hypothetical protein AUC69_14350 [Methyloceanibacter superfactus]
MTTATQRPNAPRAGASRHGAEPFVAETLSQIEASTLRNPLAAVAVAAGVGFMISKLRLDKAARSLGLFPMIASAAFGYWLKPRAD